MTEMNQDVNIKENESIEDNINTKKEGNVEKNVRKKKNGKGTKRFLQFLQHSLITAAAVILLVVISGSTVTVHDLYGNRRYTYTLWDVDPNEKYEDSDVFYAVFSRAISDVIRFGVLRSQMETDGEFDGKKIIDVTAYNNRTSAMPERYVTAEYYLEDLLKWENYGLEYANYSTDSKEMKNFLSNNTMVTVLNNNSLSGLSNDYYYLKTPEGIYTSDVSGNSITDDTTIDISQYII